LFHFLRNKRTRNRSVEPQIRNVQEMVAVLYCCSKIPIATARAVLMSGYERGVFTSKK
jgi:hypothetical protein